MSENILVVPDVPHTPAIAITAAGEEAKRVLMRGAERTVVIGGTVDRDNAIEVASRIKAHLKEVEANRQEVLKPFHEVVAQINRAARDHVSLLDAELKRINRSVGEFEDKRIREEQMEQLRLAQEAERQRQTIEAENLADELKDGDAEQKQPEDKAARLEALLDAEEKLESVTNKMQLGDTQRARGGAMRRDWDIIITDIKALYAAHPQCVELTARTLAIKDLLKTGITPAGVTATVKNTYAARAKR